jgi:hypothetical protein
VQSDRDRDEAVTKLKRLTASEDFIHGEEESRSQAKGLLKQIEDIDISLMSTKQRMRYEIEKQIGKET